MPNYIDFNEPGEGGSSGYKAKIDESINMLRQPPVSSTPTGGTDGTNYEVEAWAAVTITDGLTYTFKAHTANTGPCNVEHSQSPELSIKLIDGTDPVAGQIAEGGVYNLLRDGSNLVLLNPEISVASVSGYVAGTKIYLWDGADSMPNYSLIANLTHNTFESIGPTGSSADNIWSDLDSIPSDAKSLIMQGIVMVRNSGSTSNGYNNGFIQVRKTGTSSYSQIIASAEFGFNISSSVSSRIIGHEVIVPLDASNRFDAKWLMDGDATTGIGAGASLNLVGFIN